MRCKFCKNKHGMIGDVVCPYTFINKSSLPISYEKESFFALEINPPVLSQSMFRNENLIGGNSKLQELVEIKAGYEADHYQRRILSPKR